MTELQKQAMTEIALEDGYTEDDIQKMLEMAELLFGDLCVVH